MARPTGVADGIRFERALRGLLSVPRRAAAGTRGAPQEPQEPGDPEEPREHEDQEEPEELRILSLCPYLSSTWAKRIVKTQIT